MNKNYNPFGLGRNTWRNIDESTGKDFIKSNSKKSFQTSFSALFLLLLFCFGLSTQGQSTANYTFSTNTTSSLALDANANTVDMSTGTTQLVAPSSDQGVSTVTTIGFDFRFMGNLFTQFSASANGIMQLGGTAVSGSTYVASGGTNVLPKLSAFGGDLQTGSAGRVHFKVVGTAPNRCLVVEFLNMNLYYASAIFGNDATYQVRLYEATGVVEYIYGTVTVSKIDGFASDFSPSIGFSVGTATNTFGSVTFSTPTYNTTTSFTENPNSTVGTITELSSLANGSRRAFVFTPPSAATNPTTLTFSGVTQILTTPNWVDNSTTESWFNITRANDAAFTQNVVTTRVNSTTLATTGTVYTAPQTGLLPGVTYFYRIQAGNEGFAPSTGLTGSQITLPASANTSIASGSWSATTTWSTGVVPTSFDNVSIATGHTVTIDVAANANGLTVNGDLIYEATTLRTLTVSSNVTVNTGASFKSAATGTILGHVLNIGGSLINNGTIDFSNFANATGATIVFNSATSSNFTLGATSVTNLRNTAGVTVSKGTNISSVLTFTPGGTLTVQGANALGFLTISNGLFEIVGTNTFSNPLFSVAGYTIAATGGLRLNNANATVVGLNGSPTNNGLFNMMSGTFNIGTATGNSFGFGSLSTIMISGGTINAVSRFGVGSAANIINYNQSGGTINVNSIENLSTTLASFDLGTGAASNVSITGGTVNVILAGTALSGPRDVRGTSSTTAVLSGGIINFGTAASGASKTFFIAGRVPGFVINNTSAFHNLSLSASTQAFSSVTIPNISTLNLNGFTFVNRGATLTNNGTINGAVALSGLTFVGAVNQNFTGSGIVTSGLTLSIDKSTSSLVIDPASSGLNILRANLFSGTITNSNKITIGTGAAVSCAIQIGVTGNLFPGGSFDVAPIWNLGTGTLSLLYVQETAARTTGFEVPPTRSVAAIINDNINGLVIAGGPIDITGSLTLTNGIITSTATNFLRLAATGTLSGTPSLTNMIVGPFSRSFAASRTAVGTYDNTTLFPVGKVGGYHPIFVDPTTTGGGTVTFNSEAFTSNAGTSGAGVTSLSTNRFQALATNGAANLTSAFVRLTDAAIVATNKTLQSETAAGVYNPIASPIAFSTSTLTNSTPILAANYSGFFAYGNVANCLAPTNQATALVFSNKATTSVTLTYTAAISAPTGYLVVRYPAAGVLTNPTDLVTYAPAATLGVGTVISFGPNLNLNVNGLTANTAYDFVIYSYNNSGCSGPVYNIVTPLLASVTTCATNIAVSGNPTASLNTTNSFTASWTASATPAVTYVVDVATNNTFTSFVTGYQNLNVGNVLTLNVTGLTIATNYFIRVRATDETCTSANSTTLATSTTCNASNIPYLENFESVTTPALPACTLNINAGTGNNWITATPGANGFLSKSLTYIFNSTNPANTWFFTNGLNLVAGTTYSISFRYGSNSTGFTESLKVAVGNAANVAAMLVAPSNTLVDYPTINQATSQNGVATFTPATDGIYYLGFNAYSITDRNRLYVDDILVEVACSGTPTPGNTIASNNTVCATNPVALSLQNTTSGSGVTYAWESSPDGIAAYVPIALATASTLNITSLLTTTFYRCKVTCGTNVGTSTAVQVTVPAATPAPIAVAQTVCNGSNLTSIVITGTGIKWYTALTGGVALNPLSIIVAGTFFASQTLNGCESARTSVAITTSDCSFPYANLQFPGTSTIYGCNNETFYARVYKAGVTEAPGAGVGMSAWIAVSSTNTDPATWPLSAWQPATFNVQNGNDDEFQYTTSGLGTGTYYVASRFQYAINPNSTSPFIYGGFSSGGGGIWNGTNNVSAVLTVITVPSPTAAPTQAFCNAGTVADLVATGTGIKWYAASTGGNALLATATLTTGNYYATQTLVSCESPLRTLVAVTVNVPAAPTAVAQIICNAGTIADLVTTSGTNIKWYTTATLGTALAPTTALVAGTYFASQTIGTCESIARTPVVVTINIPVAPTAIAQTFCNSGTVADLVTTSGTNIKWYTTATLGTALAPTATLATGTYFASQTIGTCEGIARTGVTVTVTIPAAPTAIAQVICNSGTVANLVTTSGTNIKWYTTATLGTALAPTTALSTGTYFASQTIGTCESIARTSVVVTISTPVAPTAVAQAFCNSGTVADLVTTSGTNIKWYTTATLGTALAPTTALVAGTYFASQTIGTCESITRTSIAVTINTVAAPAGATTQNFNLLSSAPSKTIADLVANGTNVVWFSSIANAQANTNPLPSSTVLTNNTTYYAMQTVGSCRSGSPLAVLVTIVLGVNGYEFSGLEFYPNPVNNKLTINNSNAISSIEVFNMLGQKVATSTPNALTTQLDMSNLQAGTYLIQLVSESKIKMLKVLKN